MRASVEVQIWRLCILFLAGAACDVVFHLLRAFRMVFRPKDLGYHLLDAMVALVLTGGLGLVILIVNWGELRLYIPLALGLGALLTHLLVGHPTYRAGFLAFGSVRRWVAWVHRQITSPVKRLLSGLLQRVKGAFLPEEPPED